MTLGPLSDNLDGSVGDIFERGKHMNLAFASLGFIVRRLGPAGILLLVGWYGGAKYGAPEYATSLVDPLFERAEAVVATALGREADADEADADADADG